MYVVLLVAKKDNQYRIVDTFRYDCKMRRMRTRTRMRRWKEEDEFRALMMQMKLAVSPIHARPYEH